MKNKNGESKKVVAILLIALALIGIYFYYTSTHIKTITEHAQPADISKSESGTGLKLHVYDLDGNEINVPSWFSTSQGSVSKEGYAIIKSPSPTACSISSSCPNYASDPTHIMCWQGYCSLGNVGYIGLDYSVQNTGSSGVIFNNVGVYSASPNEFNLAANKTIVNGLSSGQTVTFAMNPINKMAVSTWIGTNKTFIVNASGVSNYNNQTYLAGDMYTLGFYNDPTSSLSISLVRVL